MPTPGKVLFTPRLICDLSGIVNPLHLLFHLHTAPWSPPRHRRHCNNERARWGITASRSNCFLCHTCTVNVCSVRARARVCALKDALTRLINGGPDGRSRFPAPLSSVPGEGNDLLRFYGKVMRQRCWLKTTARGNYQGVIHSPASDQ